MSLPWHEVERRLGRRLTDEARRHLEGKLSVPPDLADEYLDDLVADAEELLEVVDGFYGHKASRRQAAQPLAARHRHRAVSEILATEASRDAQVVSFRRAHLPAGLLDWAKVEEWIQRMSNLDGAPSVQVIASWIESGVSTALPRRRPDKVRYTSETLAYAVPDDSWRRVTGVNEHGVLGTLRQLSERLAVEYGWQPGQATVYVLTGLTPETNALRVTRPTIAPIANGVPQPWRMRIRLEVDVTERPEAVAQAFRRARSEMAGLRGRRRARLLSERMYALAEHAARRPPDEPWSTTMRRWDDAHPAWAYGRRADAVRQFRSEAREAIRRTLDPLRTP